MTDWRGWRGSGATRPRAAGARGPAHHVWTSFEVLVGLIALILGLLILSSPIMSLIGFLRARQLCRPRSALEDTVRALDARVEGLARTQARMKTAPTGRRAGAAARPRRRRSRTADARPAAVAAPAPPPCRRARPRLRCRAAGHRSARPALSPAAGACRRRAGARRGAAAAPTPTPPPLPAAAGRPPRVDVAAAAAGRRAARAIAGARPASAARAAAGPPVGTAAARRPRLRLGEPARRPRRRLGRPASRSSSPRSSSPSGRRQGYFARIFRAVRV